MVPDTERIRAQLTTMGANLKNADANSTYRLAHIEQEVCCRSPVDPRLIVMLPVFCFFYLSGFNATR